MDINEVFTTADLLYAREAVETALDRMAEAISARLKNSDPVLLCVLTGGIVPVGHLLTRLNFPLQLDYAHATRYDNQTSGGDLNWIAQPSISLAGRVVLVVDDILDEGITLDALINYVHSAGAVDVLSAVLVRKDRPRRIALQPDFVGLEIPDRYVFGYGMDYHGYWRNAAGIYAVKGL